MALGVHADEGGGGGDGLCVGDHRWQSVRDLLLAAPDEAAGDCGSVGRERVGPDKEDGGFEKPSDVVFSFIGVFVGVNSFFLKSLITLIASPSTCFWNCTMSEEALQPTEEREHVTPISLSDTLSQQIRVNPSISL